MRITAGILVFFCSAWAGATEAVSSQYGQSIANQGVPSAALKSEAAAPASGSFAIPYILTGKIVKRGRVEFELITQDGREFELIAKNKAVAALMKLAALSRTIYRVEGWAKSADEVSLLRVDKLSAEKTDSGQPAYHVSQRPARLLALYNDKITITNVRWGAKAGGYEWETAEINPRLLDEVYFVRKPFFPELVASHALMLFTFRPGGFKNSKGGDSRGLVLSVEAVMRPPYGTPNIFSTIARNFNIIWLFASWEDYVPFTVIGERKKLVAHLLLLSREQKIRLLCEAVRLGTIPRGGEFFHIITNNCATSQIVLLNRVLEKNKQIKLFFNPALYYPNANVPNITYKDLQDSGIISEPVFTTDSQNWKNHLVRTK